MTKQSSVYKTCADGAQYLLSIIYYLLSIIYALFICQWVGVVINIGDFGHIYLGIQLRCG